MQAPAVSRLPAAGVEVDDLPGDRGFGLARKPASFCSSI